MVDVDRRFHHSALLAEFAKRVVVEFQGAQPAPAACCVHLAPLLGVIIANSRLFAFEPFDSRHIFLTQFSGLVVSGTKPY